MSPVVRWFLSVAAALALACCSSGERRPLDDEAFLGCWAGRREGALWRIHFDAVIFPRAGVVSASRTCDLVRLDMHFYGNYPRNFDAFERARRNRFELVGIRGGEALVSIERREAPYLLVVKVERLISGQVLPPDDTDRLLKEMEH